MLKIFSHEVLQEVNMTTRLAIITASIIGITSLHYLTPVTFPVLLYMKFFRSFIIYQFFLQHSGSV
jgi:hypothetical protein